MSERSAFIRARPVHLLLESHNTFRRKTAAGGELVIPQSGRTNYEIDCGQNKDVLQREKEVGFAVQEEKDYIALSLFSTQFFSFLP